MVEWSDIVRWRGYSRSRRTANELRIYSIRCCKQGTSSPFRLARSHTLSDSSSGQRAQLSRSRRAENSSIASLARETKLDKKPIRHDNMTRADPPNVQELTSVTGRSHDAWERSSKLPYSPRERWSLSHSRLRLRAATLLGGEPLAKLLGAMPYQPTTTRYRIVQAVRATAREFSMARIFACNRLHDDRRSQCRL